MTETEIRPARRPVGLLILCGVTLLALIAGVVTMVLVRRAAQPESRIVQEASTAEMARVVLQTADGADTLDNTSLGYYFWSEYFALSESGQFDTTQPLDAQIYDAETGLTWLDYLLAAALQTAQETIALCRSQPDFILPDDYAESLEDTLSRFSDYAAVNGFETADGEPDLDAYLQASYGPGANEDSFRAYLTASYRASAIATEMATDENGEENWDGFWLQLDEFIADCGFSVDTDAIVLLSPAGL